MTKYGQSAISRETRLLLVTIVVSVAALWLLARVRFQERTPAAAPVQPVLAQLRPQSSYADLALSLAELRPALTAAVTPVGAGRTALRVGGTAGVALSENGLELVTLEQGDVPSISVWEPRILEYPRYVVAVDAFGDGVSARPLFLGSLALADTQLWDAPVWRLPAGTAVTPGTFIFTTDGRLAGLVVRIEQDVQAIVPGALVLEHANRLHDRPPRTPGYVGFDVQLTPLGVVVSRVDPKGPAASRLVATDVVETVGGRPVSTIELWNRLLGEVDAGEELNLRVRRAGEVLDVTVTPSVPVQEPDADAPLGLRLRYVRGVGVEVLEVAERSSAARAGIVVNDVITAVEGTEAPAVAQVTRAFDALEPGGTMLVALARGNEHRVVVLTR